MKENLQYATMTGDLGGEKIAMRFDENSLVHLMSVLTNLYSDKLLAMVREYSTNALDAHVEAGTTRPIEVTTPTGLHPYLTIKDYGIGLNKESITNVYSLYGASTKRDTNTQTGMLGLGCKSALTYTNQFTVTGIKDGIKTLVSISRSGDGSGTMEVVDESTTTEPNGVTVQIPCRDISVRNTAEDFFQYWKPGTVLLNNADPSVKLDNEIAPGVFLRKNPNGGGKDKIVMGNVAYPVEDGLYAFPYGSRYTYSVIAFVDMGEVNFTPSREQLHFTNLTKTTVDNLTAKVRVGLSKSFQKRIDNCNGPAAAIQIGREFDQIFGNGINSLTYKGKLLPTKLSFGVPDPMWTYDALAYRHKISNITLGQYDVNLWNHSVGQYMIITDYEPTANGNVSAAHRAKIDAYRDNLPDTHRNVFLYTDKGPKDNFWFTDIKTVAWKDIKDIKVNRDLGRPPRPPAKYPVLVETSGHISEQEEDSLIGNILYISSAEMKEHEFSRNDLRPLMKYGTVCVLGRNRWDKLKRDYPQAAHYSTKVQEIVDAVSNSLTDLDKCVMNTGYMYGTLYNINPKEFDDTDLAAAITALNGRENNARIKDFNSVRKFAYSMGVNVDVPTKKFIVFNKYPLALNANNVSKQHIISYCNLVYKENF